MEQQTRERSEFYDEEGPSSRLSMGIDDNSHVGQQPNRRRSSEGEEVLASKESQAVQRTKILVGLVLLVVATIVAVSSYVILSNSEKEAFESAWADEASKVLQSFQSSAARRVEAIDNFSKQITAYVLNTPEVEWPFVTVPHYEELGRSVIRLADVIDMIFHPVVSVAQRLEWEHYVMDNAHWMYDSLDVQRGDSVISDKYGHLDPRTKQRNHVCLDLSYNITVIDPLERDPAGEMCPTLYGFSDQGMPQQLPDDETGPYVVNWQSAPFVPLPSVMNLNTLAFKNIAGPVRTSLLTKRGALGGSVVLAGLTAPDQQLQRDYISLFLEFWKQDRKATGEAYQGFPNTVYWYPVFDRLVDFRGNNTQAIENAEVVALLATNVYWQTYFTKILPENSNGVVVVMENTCDQVYTFQINGPEAEFLGEGDLHDTDYEEYRVDAKFDAFTTTSTQDSLKYGACAYSLRVYPSSTFEETYQTNTPLIYSLVLVVLFAFTSAVFILYDCLVEKRQHVVLDTAVKSSAIVQELFPQNVRDRLYDEKQQQQQNKTNSKGRNLDDAASKFLEMADQDQRPAGNGDPIADLFPNCTVLFADIAGFTKWSSKRNPVEVFKLLEGIYGEMDRIAKRRKVFKIETIGDCYLAAVGLPEPRENHALVMCVYAGECLRKVKVVIEEKLRHQLGDDTLDLKLRFGLHSGPVTAGVLRGEKSRFQVFGDTVNVASRMESTGVPDKIQISEETAKLVQNAGKGAWLTKREDQVEAKGKGKMVTYWVNHRGARSTAGSVGASTTSCNTDTTESCLEEDLFPTAATTSTTTTSPRVVMFNDDSRFEQVAEV